MSQVPTIREAIEEYEQEMRANGQAEGTISIYVSYLRRLATTCEKAGRVSVRAVDTACMTRYLATMAGTASRNSAISATKGFFGWAVRMHYATPAGAADVLGGRKRSVQTRRPKHYVDVTEFEEMLGFAEQPHPWDRAVVAVLLYTLCRQSEASALQLKNVNLLKGELKVWRGKRHRWTTTIISPDLREELDWWLSWYAEDQGYDSPAAMMSAHPDWYLLPRKVAVMGKTDKGQWQRAGDRIIPAARSYALENVIKPLLDALGAEGEHGYTRRHLGEGGHTIRRSGARALLDYLEGEMGADRALLQVSAMLDHDDPQQTLTYIGREIEKDRLDKFLRSNRMYGGSGRRRQSQGAKVSALPLRGSQVHGDGRTASDTDGGLPEVAESI
jgi:integrase